MKNKTYKKPQIFLALSAILTLLFSIAAQTAGFTYPRCLRNRVIPANTNHDFEFRLFDIKQV